MGKEVETEAGIKNQEFQGRARSDQLDPGNFTTQYMRNPDMVYVVKMEYVSKINIFGLKIMGKSGLEKTFMKFLHSQSLVRKIFFNFIERRFISRNCKFSNENDLLFAHG